MGTPLTAVTLAAAIACALVGGVLFAFSTFVMPALRELPAAQAIPAMQAINRWAVTPGFMLAFGGAAVLCLVLAVAAVVRWGEPGSPWLLAGALVHLAGVVGLTAAHHVPRNDALARVDPQAADAAARWAAYCAEWLPLNHVRAAAGAVAGGLLVAALLAS